MKKIGIISLSILLLITGCSGDNKKEMLEKVLKEGNYIVVDVRTSEEYETGHVKDSINIPYDEIDENVDLDQDKTILVYCKSGTRSNIAYETLKDLGYEVIDLGAYESVTLEREEIENESVD